MRRLNMLCGVRDKCPMLRDAERRAHDAEKLNRFLQDQLMIEINMRRNAEAQSLIDPLTGAMNRRGLEQKFTEECAKTTRLGRKLFMVFMDIDNFRVFNNEHGENTGDLVLKHVVNRIHESIRPYDSLFRIGGEEFVVLLPEIKTYQTACRLAERIRKRIKSLRITPHDGGGKLGVTVSVGVAILRKGESLEKLVDKANQAEQQAKAAGKNCTYLYLGDELLPVKNLV